MGVSNRLRALQCQSAHQHTFKQDLSEINVWVGWLKNKGYRSIIIVGHSWGSIHSLGYVTQYKDKVIKGIIAISLVKNKYNIEKFNKQYRRAKRSLREHKHQLHQYQLSFCSNYTSNPTSYLSYADWTNRKIKHQLKLLKRKHMPVYVINGGKDKRTDPRWTAFLRKNTRNVSIVAGANHFFSSVHELELADNIEKVLDKLSTRP